MTDLCAQDEVCNIWGEMKMKNSLYSVCIRQILLLEHREVGDGIKICLGDGSSDLCENGEICNPAGTVRMKNSLNSICISYVGSAVLFVTLMTSLITFTNNPSP